MKTETNRMKALALCAMVAMAGVARGTIVSDFNDSVYPGAAVDGWAGGWQHSVGTPVVETTTPMDANTPYLHYDATGSTIRNLMRQYEPGAGVNPAMPHYIRWKLRVGDAGFTTFTANTDRFHFFGRRGARLTSSTDVEVSWSIVAAGAAHSTGAWAGKTFWIFDNLDGTGNFTLANHVDSGITVVPNHIYAFQVYVMPEQKSFTVSIADETAGVTFTSAAPHAFRALAPDGASHTYLHWGTQAGSSTEVRPFDLDSVSISPWDGPVLQKVSPENGAVHPATSNVQFSVTSVQPINTGDIGVTLNSVNITSQLQVTGAATNRQVSFGGLQPNMKYKMEVAVTNSIGRAGFTTFFYTPENAPVTIFDSGGFADDILYPVGAMTAATNNDCYWAFSEPTEPAEIVDLADGVHGKVMRRMQMGADRIEKLCFPPIASGTLTAEFDVKISSLAGRVLDVALTPMSGTGTQGPFLMWGTNALNYFDGLQWVPLQALDTGWHHFELVSYVSGGKGGTFDIKVDNVSVGSGLAWRSLFNPVGGIRVGAIRGDIMQYGDLDNFVVKLSREVLVALPVTLQNAAMSQTGLSFSFQTLAGINYTVLYSADVTAAPAAWTWLETVVGDGAARTVTHTNPPAGRLFYKVKSELP